MSFSLIGRKKWASAKLRRQQRYAGATDARTPNQPRPHLRIEKRSRLDAETTVIPDAGLAAYGSRYFGQAQVFPGRAVIRCKLGVVFIARNRRQPPLSRSKALPFQLAGWLATAGPAQEIPPAFRRVCTA